MSLLEARMADRVATLDEDERLPLPRVKQMQAPFAIHLFYF